MKLKSEHIDDALRLFDASVIAMLGRINVPGITVDWMVRTAGDIAKAREDLRHVMGRDNEG